MRSKDLVNWESGHYNGGVILAPDHPVCNRSSNGDVLKLPIM